MAIPALSIDKKTAEEIRAELIARIPSITDRWTDHNDYDLGIVILTLLSGLQETMQLELDIRASEMTLAHVRQRANGIRLLKLIGYEFKRRVAATSTMRVTLGSTHSASVPLVPYFDATPTYFKTRTSTPIYFVPAQRSSIPAGSLQVDVGVLQGKRQADTFVAVGGEADQIFTLSSKNAAEGTIRASVNGVPWTEVESFYASDADDRHFVVVTDIDGTIRVQTGDGVFGQIPSGSLEVAYVVTDGKAGNIFGPGKITELDAVLKDSTGANLAIPVSVTNIVSASNGDDEESLWHAKKVAPRVYAAQQRAVTKADFDAWSEDFPGVKQAKSFDINDVGPESFEIDFYEVKIVIVPQSGNYPSAQLKRDLQNYLETLKDVPDNIEVVDPEYVNVPVSVDIFVKKPPFDPNVVKSNVQTTIQNYFAAASAPSGELAIGGEVEGQTFGTNVSIAGLLVAIGAVDGVAAISTHSPTSDVVIKAFQIATLAAGSPVVNVLGAI